MIFRVSRLVANELTNQAITQKVHITNRIQDFVPDELIFVTQTIVVQDAVLIHHNGIIQTATLSKVTFSQVLKLLHQAKRSSPANFLDK